MPISQSIPFGFCHCGCGRRTPLAARSRRGVRAGDPARFVLGHNTATGTAKPRPAITLSDQLCACGCGQRTSIARFSNATAGYVKGRPMVYAAHHSSRVHRRGYRSVRVNGEARSEHVVVAERALGRPLPAGAAVHHVDGNRRNNTPSNLVICQDAVYHNLLHLRARTLRLGGNPDTERYCGDCVTVKPFAAFNLRTSKQGMRPQSVCRACQSIRFKAWSAKRKAAKAA